MSNVEFSGSQQQLRDSVRAFLGGVSDNFLKDDVIDEQANRDVIPYINRHIEAEEYEQDDIDNAIIAYTADRAYNSIPLKSTVSGGGLTTNYATEQYRREIRQRSSAALAALDITPPHRGPSAVVGRTSGMLR